MKSRWLDQCEHLAQRLATFYSGCRKIITNTTLYYEDLDSDLSIRDCGFTKSKLTMLKRLYLHEESHAMAIQLWRRRVGQGKYGSVGFTTYNHLLKADPTKKSKRASVMGPCIQAVTLTLMPDKSAVIDAFYRTTELLKKFPADLVFIRDILLPPFELTKVKQLRFHFANVTVHPMYWVTIVPHQKDPIKVLERIKQKDRRFYDWAVKWSARYLCDEFMHGIQKFGQAMRVRKDALERIEPATIKDLQKYLRANHPGYRRIINGEYD